MSTNEKSRSDSYVGRESRSRGQVFGTDKDEDILKAINAKGNAMRRTQAVGRRKNRKGGRSHGRGAA
ncbi:MAG: hypothetical protein AAGD32_03395 [Planctomycetota bacterium]